MAQATRRRPVKPEISRYHPRKKAEQVRITVFQYNEKDYCEKTAARVEDCFACTFDPAVTWINVDGVHQPEIIETLAGHYDLHPLLQESIRQTTQRPKLEDYGEYVYIALKMFYLDEKKTAHHHRARQLCPRGGICHFFSGNGRRRLRLHPR